MEAVFRRHAALLQSARATPGRPAWRLMARRCAAASTSSAIAPPPQVLGAFATDTALVLAHSDIDEKSNEVPAAQALLAELGLARTPSSRSTRCTAKKTFEAGAAAEIALIIKSRTTSRPCTGKRGCLGQRGAALVRQ